MTDIFQQPFGACALSPQLQKRLALAQSMPVNWLGRRLALLLRKTVLRHGMQAIDATVDGLGLRLYMQDNVSERKFLFMPQFFDAAERSLLKSRLKKGDIFVDIGANAGIYSFTAAACIGSQGRVVAIEPNPALHPRFLFNVAQNGFEKQITLLQLGISDEKGSFNLTLDHGNLGGSSLVTARSSDQITVKCQPLKDVLMDEGIERIDALKIDIEGAEDRALVPFFRSAPVLLWPKLLILENSPMDWKQDLQAVLKECGYRKAMTTRMNMVWEKS